MPAPDCTGQFDLFSGGEVPKQIIAVDAVFKAGAGALRGNWCHLITNDWTPAGLERLHKFAQSIGLKRAWFQTPDTHPHYDLRGYAKRRQAVQAGALELERDAFCALLEQGRVSIGRPTLGERLSCLRMAQ